MENKDKDYMAVSRNLQRLLKEQNMPAGELAEKVGVTKINMERFVSGKRVPRGPIIANMATVLKCKPEDIIF